MHLDKNVTLAPSIFQYSMHGFTSHNIVAKSKQKAKTWEFYV